MPPDASWIGWLRTDILELRQLLIQTMLLLALAIFVILLYRLGQFEEYLGFKEIRQLDSHIMQAYDDASWEDKMTDFRVNHSQPLSRPYMSFGSRR